MNNNSPLTHCINLQLSVMPNWQFPLISNLSSLHPT